VKTLTVDGNKTKLAIWVSRRSVNHLIGLLLKFILLLSLELVEDCIT